jgi:hypothetical protein
MISLQKNRMQQVAVHPVFLYYSGENQIYLLAQQVTN